MPILNPPEASHRIDHQSYGPEIWAGLFLASLYLLQSPPVMDTLENHAERALSVLLGVGSLICLIGAAVGTPVLLPDARYKTAYRWQLVGLPLIIFALAWYTYLAIDPAGQQQTLVTAALGGGLGLFIEIGSLRMFFDLIAATKGVP